MTDKQIEEMAVIGCVRNPQAYTAEECTKCGFKQGMCNAYRHAEALYNAGYRKTFTNEMYKDALNLITEQEKEIKRLKAENKKYLDSIESVQAGRCRLICPLTEQAVKQAKIDVLNELKDKMFEREYMGVKYKERIFYESEINDMIAEVQNAED